jgi:hypothetical protein
VWGVQIDELGGSPIESVVVEEDGQGTVLDPDLGDPSLPPCGCLRFCRRAYSRGNRLIKRKREKISLFKKF